MDCLLGKRAGEIDTALGAGRLQLKLIRIVGLASDGIFKEKRLCNIDDENPAVFCSRSQMKQSLFSLMAEKSQCANYDEISTIYCSGSSLVHEEVVANIDSTLPVNENGLWHIDVKKYVLFCSVT